MDVHKILTDAAGSERLGPAVRKWKWRRILPNSSGLLWTK